MKYELIYRLGEELGKGQFGMVVRGTWSEGKEEEKGEEKEESEVAVKMLKKSSAISSIIKFLREAVIMGQFSHPNVVKLYGVVTEGEPVRGEREEGYGERWVREEWVG